MGNNNQLQFVIKAIDEASSALNAVKESVAKMQSSVDSANGSMGKLGDELSKVKGEHESMTAAVFKGTAAWDLFKEGLHMAVDFLKESVAKSLEMQRTLDLVRSTVESTGMSFKKAEPMLTEFGDKMEKLGVDGEDAQLSAAKLAKMVGGDLAKGFELAKLASDLTSSGYGDLQSNTESLAGVLAGRGVMAIREFKLNLDATATTGEILNAIQQKVTMTTEEYADTIPGKIATVQKAYDSLQETIGSAFTSAVSNAIEDTGDFTDALDVMKDVGKGVGVVVFEVVNAVVLVAKAFRTAYEEAKLVVTAFEAVYDAMTGNFQKGKDELQAAFDSVNTSIASTNKTLGEMMHPLVAIEEQTKKNAAAHRDYGATHANIGDGIANTNKAATKDFMSHADAVKALGDAYKDMTAKAATDMATFSDDHNKAMAEIQKSIEATTKSMANLTAEYNRAATDDTAAMADKIIESQQKVSDLKKQIASTDDKIKQADLQKQLNTEQQGLDASADFQKQNSAAITEAKRRASLTQIQRDLEDYKNRRALATQEYNDKLADLQAQLAAEYQKKNEEEALYTARNKKISELVKAANDEYKAASESRIQQTKDEVNQEIQAFAALASAISAVRTASASAVTTYSVPNFGGKREMGGPVSGKTSYLVGEKGPELFTPTTDGTIIPNNALNSGNGGINVFITGNNISNNMDVKNIAQKVGEEIMRTLRMSGKLAL